jgi:hypothetical protein
LCAIRSYTDTHAYRNGHSDPYCDCNSYANAYADSYSNTYSYTNPYANHDSDAYCNPLCRAYGHDERGQ